MHNTLVISQWTDLVNAVSNIDRSYRIRVTEINDSTLCTGTQVTIYKQSYMDKGNVDLMTFFVQLAATYCDSITNSNVIPRAQALQYINNFGFDVLWQNIPNITENTRSLLTGLYTLGYNYILARPSEYDAISVDRFIEVFTTDNLSDADSILVNDLPLYNQCDFAWLATNMMYSISLLLS